MDNLNFEIERFVNELKEFKSEKDKLIRTCEQMINCYKDKINKYEEMIKDKETFIKNNIDTLLEVHSNELKETKTELNYKVPSAKLFYKKASEKMALSDNLKDDDDLKIEKVPSRFLQNIISINWSAYKRILKIVDNQVINTQTGEIVDSVDIIKTDKSDLNIKFL